MLDLDDISTTETEATPAPDEKAPDTKSYGPGYYTHVDDHQYWMTEALSSSGMLKLLPPEKTPAHYKDYLERKAEAVAKGEDLESTPALEFGKLYHCFVLEPDRFNDRYALPLPDEALAGALKTTEDLKTRCKELGEKVSGKKEELIERILSKDPEAKIAERLITAHAAKNEGKEIVDAASYEQVVAMRELLLANERIRRLVEGEGDREAVIIWKDEETGVLLKVKFDFIAHFHADEHVVRYPGDIKTTRQADPDYISRDIYNRGYHILAAMYHAAFKAQFDEDLGRRWAWIFQEKDRPYLPIIYEPKPEMIAFGHERFRQGVRLYAECLEKDEWPGFPSAPQEIDIPAWAYRK